MARTLSAPRPRTQLITAFKAAMGAPYWTLISQAERDQAVKDGNAMPDGSYPTRNCDEVQTAIKAVGRGGADHDKIRRHIIAQIAKHNCGDITPDTWNPDGSLKTAAANVTGLADNPDAETVSDAGPSDASAPTPPKSDAPTVGASPSDSDVAKAIADFETAYEAVVSAQAKDPDVTDPDDIAITTKLSALKPLIDDLKAAQDTDMAKPAEAATAPKDTATNTPADKPGDKAPPSKAPPAASPGNMAIVNTTPKINPVDEDGNVDNDAVCANSEVKCGHVASVHGDTDMGDNTGVCATPGCECQGFVVDTGTQVGGDPTAGGDGGGADNAGGDDDAPPTAEIHASAFADTSKEPAPAAPDVPENAEATGTVEDEASPVPSTPGAMNMGPAFTMVALIEGIPTSDGRFIAPNALSWENPPWALMGKATSAHDPMGMDSDDPAVICGRIDSYERQAGPNGTQLIVGQGYFLSNDDGMYFADLLDQMGRLPVSGDVSVGVTSETLVEPDENGQVNMLVTLTEGTVEATTILPFGPAFADCYIVLGGNLETPAIPVQTPEQAPMTASGQVVHWMAEADCVPCGWADDVLVAAANIAPVRPPRSWFEDPKFAEGDGRLKLMTGETKYGRMVDFKACRITVTQEGEVFGHIAPWGICHIGIKGECVVAPHSKTDYALFKRGQYMVTAEGDEVRVGILTAGVGHASDALGARATMDHYDNSALQTAYVNIGEDAYGIWVHGVIAADATEGQIQKLRASTPSGDWRIWGGNLELCAALVVNEPGYVPAVKSVTAHGRQVALVGAGAQEMDALTNPEAVTASGYDPAILRLIRKDARATFSELGRDIAADARARIAELARV